MDFKEGLASLNCPMKKFYVDLKERPNIVDCTHREIGPQYHSVDSRLFGSMTMFAVGFRSERLKGMTV